MTTINNNTKPKLNRETAPLFAIDYKVYINHTDAGGIVYHANHLVFFENCRRDWFTTLGLNGYFLQTNSGEIQHFVVSQADLQYKKAILLDETITVCIDKVELKPASIIFYQSIHRQASTGNNGDKKASQALLQNTLLSRTKIVVACVQNQITPDSMPNEHTDASPNHSAPMRPIRVPQKLQDAIQKAISNYTHP